MNVDGKASIHKDYRDKLLLQGPRGAELRESLGLDTGTECEARQCVIWNIVGAVLWARSGKPPRTAEVQGTALLER